MKIKNLLLLFFMLSSCFCSQADIKPIFPLSQTSLSLSSPDKAKDIAKPGKTQKTINKADISCIIVDLKYNPYNANPIKILEFGRLEMSRFKGHNKLFTPGIIWDHFWDYLNSFGLPIWYAGQGYSNDGTLRGLDYLKKIGGTHYHTFNELQKDIVFAQAIKREITKPTKIKNYNGIFISKCHTGTKLKKLQAKYPNILIVNNKTVHYCASKHRASRLFEDKELQNFKPKWKTYPAKYTKNLANQILQDLETDKVVIKPTNSSKGKGVIIIDKDNLDKTLKNIFKNKENIKYHKDVAYNYWLNHTRNVFLVESFEESKPILINNKKYDATMRIIFILDHNNNKINFEIVSSYWKLPIKSLDQAGTLLEKHKSKIKEGQICSAKVSEIDIKNIEIILKPTLIKLYKKMLEIA